MLTPTGVSRADYSAAVMSGAAQHARMVFDNGVTLTEQDMESGGLVIRDILNGDTNLTFGRAVMKELSVNLLNSSRLNGLGWTSEFTLELGVEISGTTNWVTIGKFQGSKPEKIHYVDVIQFTAYDRMQRFTGDAGKFLESLTYPITFGNMLQALCTFEGVTYTAGSELAGMMSRSFAKGFMNAEGLTTRDLLALMAEACGCYARIDSTGKMKMLWYADNGYSIVPSMEISIDTYDLESGELWDDLGEGTWNDAADKTWNETGGYQAVFSVDGLRSILTENDTGVSYGSLNGNVYTIVDNPFLVISEDTDKAYVEALWNRLKAFGGYLPMHLECAGNWLVEAGDIVTVDVRGNSVSMPVFVKETAWNGGCIDRMEATGEIGKPIYSNEVSQKLSQGGKFHEFRNDIDGLASRVGDAEGNITELEQTAEGLTTRVEDAESDITTLTQTAQGLSVEVSRKARVYYAASAPAGTAEDPLETGDLWIDTANANQMKRWDGNAWVDVSFDDPDKYTVRSGIDITAAGIDITGAQYVKIGSSGYFKVDTPNFLMDGDAKTIYIDVTDFKIDSANKTLKTGNWTLASGGLYWQTSPYQFYIKKTTVGNLDAIFFQFNNTNLGETYGFYLMYDGNVIPYETIFPGDIKQTPNIGASDVRWNIGYFNDVRVKNGFTWNDLKGT